MKIKTRVFGEIELAEEKIIRFADGIIGFPEFKEFVLLYDEEDGEKSTVRWLQSLEEPEFALPVIEPFLVVPDYAFQFDDEATTCMGDLTEENVLALVTLTAPEDVKEMSVNLKAPIIINIDDRQACQVVVEDDYPVKYQVYELLKTKKEEGE